MRLGGFRRLRRGQLLLGWACFGWVRHDKAVSVCSGLVGLHGVGHGG